MSKKLKNNLNSLYLSAANRLFSKRRKRRIVAYVESYDDVFFWRDILSDFENGKVEFEVCLPSRTDLTRGKKSVLMNELGNKLGTSMIACVDADYDYLCQRSNPVSAQIMSNPFVFHTYAYAIENLQCYAPSLHNVCVMATLNDRNIFNFEDYIKAYSIITYDLFIWSIWFHRKNRANEFTMTAFNNVASVIKLNTFHPERALEEMRKRVNHKMAQLQQLYPEAKGELGPIRQELEQLGVRRDNTYLFIQGHHIMTNVVMQALEPICNALRRQREKEIKRLAYHNKQMNCELSSYQHSQFPIEQIIRRNTDFRESEPYQKLKADLEKFIASIGEENENIEQTP